MQGAQYNGRLQLHCVTAHWSGVWRSPSDSCPCCPGRLEGPAHCVLECAGQADIRALYLAVVAAAAPVTSAGAQAATRAFLRPSHFAEVANYLLLAKRRRFAADGADHMTAVAAGLACHGDGNATIDISESSSSKMLTSHNLEQSMMRLCSHCIWLVPQASSCTARRHCQHTQILHKPLAWSYTNGHPYQDNCPCKLQEGAGAGLR
jgi:hypothetical protein